MYTHLFSMLKYFNIDMDQTVYKARYILCSFVPGNVLTLYCYAILVIIFFHLSYLIHMLDVYM